MSSSKQSLSAPKSSTSNSNSNSNSHSHPQGILRVQRPPPADISSKLNKLATDVTALNKHDAYWLKMYAKLRDYKECHGDTYVPKSYPEDQPLANWVQDQRRQYKILQKRKTTSNKCNIGGFTAQVLTDERIRMLEDELGFDWSPNLHTCYNDRKWRKMLDELRKYRDMHGHTNTHLTKDPFYSQLHSWVSYQRKQFKLKKIGKPTTLTAEKESLLNELEFNWDHPHQVKKNMNTDASSSTSGAVSSKTLDKSRTVKKRSVPADESMERSSIQRKIPTHEMTKSSSVTIKKRELHENHVSNRINMYGSTNGSLTANGLAPTASMNGSMFECYSLPPITFQPSDSSNTKYIARSLEAGFPNQGSYNRIGLLGNQGIPSLYNNHVILNSPTTQQQPRSTVWMCEKCRSAYFPSLDLALQHEMTCRATSTLRGRGSC